MHTPGGTPEFFQGLHEGLAEAKVPCSGAKCCHCVVHERENVFLKYYQIHTKHIAVKQTFDAIRKHHDPSL